MIEGRPDICGIAAIVATESRSIRAPLERAVQAIQHRGPDEQGFWFSEDEGVGLGHSRLSIVDLSGGTHPLSNEYGTIQAVVSGEFYDHRRIRSELRSLGHQLRTKSDSEILVHLYEEHGTACLNELRGEFAFVLWDGHVRKLFAARDRFGIKPLFLTRFEKGLMLASESKALFAMGAPAAWNHQAVYQNSFFCLLQNQSLFRDISQIPPGHFLLFDRNQLRLELYWDVDYPVVGKDRRLADEQECIHTLRSGLHEAIRLRMDADVPIGCYLSGGIDSSAVLQIASRYSTGPLPPLPSPFRVPLMMRAAKPG